MQEIIKEILERVNFEDKIKVQTFLLRCIQVSSDTFKSTYAIHDNILFKLDTFFKDVHNLVNHVPKNKKLPLGIDTLKIVLEELSLDVDKEEVFILYHLRDLGNFKIRDSKLQTELKSLWGEYKEYAIEDKYFQRSLKHLMRIGLIEYRKGSLRLKKSLVIRYKN